MRNSLEDNNIYYGGDLSELPVYPKYKLKLHTYYPVISKSYPYTGHSSLFLEKALIGNDGKMNGYYGNIGFVDINSNNNNYNLITNNCADATRRTLEKTFGKSSDTQLFTTPGDVRDFFKKLGAKELTEEERKGEDIHYMYLNNNQAKKLKIYLKNKMVPNGGIFYDKISDENY